MKRIARGFSQKMRVFCPDVACTSFSCRDLRCKQPNHCIKLSCPQGDVSQLIKFFKAQSPSAPAVTIVTGFPTYGLNLPA